MTEKIGKARDKVERCCGIANIPSFGHTHHTQKCVNVIALDG